MNSLLFEDLFSADFSAFSRFCEAISDEITLENSYALTKSYFSMIGKETAFARINPCEWKDYIDGYLFLEDSEPAGCSIKNVEML